MAHAHARTKTRRRQLGRIEASLAPAEAEVGAVAKADQYVPFA